MSRPEQYREGQEAPADRQAQGVQPPQEGLAGRVFRRQEVRLGREALLARSGTSFRTSAGHT
jgi:hypothetical protein